MKDRALFLTGLATLGLGLMGVMLSFSDNTGLAVFDGIPPAVNANITARWEGNASGHIKEFKLTVGRTRWELAPGKIVEAYTYNGQLPGPELRVTEGDTVRVTVTNDLTEPTTVHWHGVEVRAGMDGAPNLSQEPIPPGGAFTYQFVATPAGTRWYHSHFDEKEQQANGLTGALIIEPRREP